MIPKPHAFGRGDVRATFALQRLTRSDDVELETLLKVIEENSLLKGVFLAMANSVRVGLSTPIATPRRAVAMLGTNGVRRIVDDIALSIQSEERSFLHN